MAAKSKAFSYIRFSHPDQAKGDSLRRQTELRDAWLKRNGVALDTSLAMEDKGVSGFTGEHREASDRHALGQFLALVKGGRIPQGSYLIVENLDRLSREDIIPAMSLLLDLIQAGVRVVQLLPAEAVYDAKTNPMLLMQAIMELSRGHSESAMKSERVGAAWQDKKKRAAKNGEPLTARAPAWLTLNGGGKFEVRKGAAETIQRIYRMAVAGYGLGIITKTLNKEKVPLIGHAKHWARSYVAKLLHNRAVVGECQPFRGRAGKREADGKPIPNYFPVIVADDDWYAARAAQASRKGKAGRLSKAGHLNVFSGLLFDARDGGSFQTVDKGAKSSGRHLIPYRAHQGAEGSRMVSFPFTTFERAIFSCLREIPLAEVVPGKRKSNRSQALAGRLAELEDEIGKLKARLQVKYSDAVADVLDRQEAEAKILGTQIIEARQEEASPVAEAWGECHSLLDVIDKSPDPEEARVRLRAALRRIVEECWCLFVSKGAVRLAAVQVFFAGGARRDYLILHRGAFGNADSKRPAEWWVRSLASVAGKAKLDLRNREHARRLESVLAALDSASA